MNSTRLINSIAMLGLALSITLWSFWRFHDAAEGQVAEWEMTGQMALSEAVEVSELSVLRKEGLDAVALFPGSKANLDWSEEEGHLEVQLAEGGLLFSTLAGNMTVSVNSDFLRVDSQNNMVYVEVSEVNAQVYALEHASLVTLQLEGKDLNSVPVPSSYRVTVPKAKLSPTIERLRLTNLSKEFPVFPLKETDLDETLTSVVSEFEEAYSQTSLNFLNTLHQNGSLGPSQEGAAEKLFKTVGRLKNVFTILPHADERLENNLRSELLNYAMSNALFGDPNTGAAWLAQWENLAQETEELKQLYSDLFFVLPGEALYPVKAAVGKVLAKEEDSMTALHRQFQEVEQLLDRSSTVLAEEAYLAYQSAFQAELKAGRFDDPTHLAPISREYLLLEQLLRRHVVFYSVQDTALLTDLEQKILSLAGSDQDLDEERLAFVQSRIRFLENLFEFVVDRSLPVTDAEALSTDLILEAQNYLNEISSQVAVKTYFESQLEEFELSSQFIASPEFFFFDSYEEGLKVYARKVQDLKDLNVYLQILRSGSLDENEISPHPTLSVAIKEVESDLGSARIQFAKIEHLGDAENRLFEIVGARTSGVPFEANYDRETKLLYDVVVEEVRFSTGILLESAQQVIEQALTQTEIEVPEFEETETNTENLTEGVALDFVASEFKKAGLNPDSFEFTVTDLEENIFSFTGVIDEHDLPISGVYLSQEGKAIGIVWEFRGEPKTLPDIALSQMEAAVLATYDALVAGE